jgi:hypothetical protein
MSTSTCFKLNSASLVGSLVITPTAVKFQLKIFSLFLVPHKLYQINFRIPCEIKILTTWLSIYEFLISHYLTFIYLQLLIKYYIIKNAKFSHFLIKYLI